MTFEPNNVLLSGQGFFLPDLDAIEHSREIWPPGWPQLTPAWPFDPINAIHFSQGLFLPNLVAIGHSWAIWSLVDPSWPLHDLWPQKYIWSGVLPTIFGGHRAILKQLVLWMTFYLWWGCSKNMLSNLRGPSPTPMPSFSSKPQSTVKHVAVHTKIL